MVLLKGFNFDDTKVYWIYILYNTFQNIILTVFDI